MKRIKLIALLLVIVLATGAAGCDKKTDSMVRETAPPIVVTTDPNEVIFEFTEKNMPVIDGSTATIPLAYALKSVLLGKPMDEVEVNFSGTSSAYHNLMQEGSDILIVYEPPQELIDRYTDFYDQIEMAPIGRDGLVFLINAENSVEGLTAEQIKEIYKGNLTNWSEVGGADIAIKTYKRNSTSGSQALMEKLVMKGEEMLATESEMIIGAMGMLVEMVAQYDNSGSAIGYNVFYYVTRMNLDGNVRLLEVDGVAPTTESISKGDYPFVNDFYAVIRKDEGESSPARILYNWLQGEDGQALVKHEGYSVIEG